MPSKPTFSPQPRKGKYYTLLPINSDPGANWGLIGSFATATLPIASREGQSCNMAVCIKLPPCYRSSKWPKTELIEESVLVRGLLWKNLNFVEHSDRNIVCGKTGHPLCQEILINLGNPGSRMKYTHTGTGGLPPLTTMACTPSWDDYFDLKETVHEMVKHLMEEDEEEVHSVP